MNLKDLKVLSKAILFCFVLIFSLNAFAEVHVKISPKEGQAETAYLGELKEFELITANLGDATVNNLVIEVSTDAELILIQEHEEKAMQRFELKSISPGEKITQSLFVKPIKLSSQPSRIFANYGIEEFTDLSATYLVVSDNPVKLKASLLKPIVDLGGENVLLLDALNSGSQPLKNISVSLIAEPDILVNSQPIVIDSLNANEGIKSEFRFTPKETVRGTKTVTLSFQFADDKGVHLVEQNFSFQIQDQNTYLYVFAVIIFIILFLSYFFIKKKGKKRDTIIKGTDKTAPGVSQTDVRTKIFSDKKV